MKTFHTDEDRNLGKPSHLMLIAAHSHVRELSHLKHDVAELEACVDYLVARTHRVIVISAEKRVTCTPHFRETLDDITENVRALLAETLTVRYALGAAHAVLHDHLQQFDALYPAFVDLEKGGAS